MTLFLPLHPRKNIFLSTMNVIAQTSRLLIREFTAEDEQLLLDLDADTRLTRYVKKRTEQESKKVFKDTLRDYEKQTGLGRWGIFNLDDNDFIGVCILNYSEYDGTRIELGYRLHLKYWGSGIATELAKALVFYGLNDVGLREICAVTHPDNAASQKVLAKAGFIQHGRAFWYGESLPFFKVARSPL
ncbi:GNAT family N-acetyltransferase [Mucilaginibacter aquaedulcis]|uniref:GNAT family N-acetyltransferase n=1 Tax=Mucilaginibacter aquaedulcis TaxID=1187081 RepID=UPI0025B5AE43|nr:GNAT family N-acetyltransferase [Mucilaginibacter aquaedulcis]MDN3550961.1 GNAT family N-acetyltransferase [Mucilaginibacter aquaedulcis]